MKCRGGAARALLTLFKVREAEYNFRGDVGLIEAAVSTPGRTATPLIKEAAVRLVLKRFACVRSLFSHMDCFGSVAGLPRQLETQMDGFISCLRRNCGFKTAACVMPKHGGSGGRGARRLDLPSSSETAASEVKYISRMTPYPTRE